MAYKDKEKRNAWERQSYAANKEKRSAYAKAWRAANPDRVREYGRKYNAANPDKALERSRRWQAANREKIRAADKARRAANIEVVRQRRRIRASERYATDIEYRLACLIRQRARHALKGKVKPASALQALGCTADELWAHLERQFLPGMTRENHTRHGWHMDHIVPVAAFDLTDEEQFARAFHYTNLQPLWAQDNLSKGAKC